MTEIVKDLKRVAFLSGYIAGVKLDADKEAELRAIQAKYEKPFAPEQLIELGWGKKDFPLLIDIFDKDDFRITISKVLLQINLTTVDGITVLCTSSIPSTHAELLTLLKLVCGEGK